MPHRRRPWNLAGMLCVPALSLLAGCGTGPTIFDMLGTRYWRPESLVCADGSSTCAQPEWQTNWQTWFPTEADCLRAISPSQRCRETWL